MVGETSRTLYGTTWKRVPEEERLEEGGKGGEGLTLLDRINRRT